MNSESLTMMIGIIVGALSLGTGLIIGKFLQNRKRLKKWMETNKAMPK